MEALEQFFSTPLGGAIVAIMYVAVLAAIFTIPVGMFNTKMYRGNNGEYPHGVDWLKAYIPFGNIRYARVLAYGASPIFGVFLIVAAAIFALRFISIGLVALDIGIAMYIYVFSAFFPMAALAIWWVLAAINAIDFGGMLGAGLPTKIVCVVLPPLGYYMLSNAVLPYFKAEEVSMDGTFGS